MLWGFISRYAPEATPQSAPFLDQLVGYAITYYRDFVKPTKRTARRTRSERAALGRAAGGSRAAPADADAEDLAERGLRGRQAPPFADLRAWFKALYEVLFGQDQGPRLGSFIALYGARKPRLIRKALASPKGLAAE